MDELDRDAIQFSVESARITIREIHTGNGCEDFQTNWWNTHPNDPAWFQKHVRVGLGKRKPVESAGNAVGIFPGPPDPDVEIGGGTRETVEVDGVSAEDEILDFT